MSKRISEPRIDLKLVGVRLTLEDYVRLEKKSSVPKSQFGKYISDVMAEYLKTVPLDDADMKRVEVWKNENLSKRMERRKAFYNAIRQD